MKAEKVHEANLRKRASDALKNGRLEDAEEALLALLSVSSNPSTAHRDLSKIYFRTGDYEKALEHARPWNVQDPTKIASTILLARILRVLGRQSELPPIGQTLLSASDSTEAAQEVLRLFRDRNAESRATAIATLEALLQQTATRHDESQTRRILRTLSRSANADIFWRARSLAASCGISGLKEITAEHFLRKKLYTQALDALGVSDSSKPATAEFETLRNFALDNLAGCDLELTSVVQQERTLAELSLIDALKAAEVSEFVVFHTDHFEPWGGRFEEWQLARCEEFARLIAHHDFTRRLSLFYRPEAPFSMSRDAAPVTPELQAFGVVAPGRPRSEQERIIEAMAPLRGLSDAEFHLHVHHEDLIPCTESWGTVALEVARRVPEEQYGDLLELHVRTNLDQLARDTAVPLEQWAIIHGKWALNGSDRNVCTIDDELSRLQALGCWGDFTFPAGRRHCTPRWNAPFTVRPMTASKAYDRLNADVRLLGDTNHNMFWERGRFFIWSMPVPYNAVSLDGSFDSTTEFYDVLRALRSWISHGVRLDRALIIKTHAHSMAAEYSKDGTPVFPHFLPRNQRLFATLERICERAGVTLSYATVNEIKQRLQGGAV